MKQLLAKPACSLTKACNWAIFLLVLQPLIITEIAAQDSHKAASVQLNPLVQRIVLDKDSRQKLAWTITVRKSTKLTEARSDCGCLTITTPLPVTLEADRPQRIEGIARGGLVGTKTITLTASGVMAEAKVIIEDRNGHGQPEKEFLELVTRATREGSQVTVLAHDIRDGSPSPCQCADEPLGGVERLSSLARITNGMDPRPRLWLTGRVDPAQVSEGVGKLLSLGWKQAPDDAVVISQRPQVAVRKNKQALIIPQGARGGGHQRILDPWPGMGATVMVVVTKPNGVIKNTETFLLTGTWE